MASGARPRTELFLVSLLALFLELALIRWIPAHVLYLTFFTNGVLLACFLGISLGCLAVGQRRDWIAWTPLCLALTLGAAHGVDALRTRLERVLDVGRQADPQHVYFGTEYFVQDLARFAVPVEALGGLFFLLAALTLVGPGQELGRSLERVPGRVAAYTWNLLGSMAGVVLFFLCSWLELSPVWWFYPAACGIGWLAMRHPASRAVRAATVALLGLSAGMAGWTTGSYRAPAKGLFVWDREEVDAEHLWSPYYRIDYLHPPVRTVTVNLMGHQRMSSRSEKWLAYSLPYLLRRDAGGPPFEDVLVVGGGSGNDVSRALPFNPRRVDAVEIDPVILRLGMRDHPDSPYQDPRVAAFVDDGRNFLRSAGGTYDLVVYALVDSLALHSSYSSLRLESYLFTREAFRDVRRRLKPGGVFVLYNFFRRGWVVARIAKGLKEAFGEEPLVFTMPHSDVVLPESQGAFTMLVSGDTRGLREAFRRRPEYWLRKDVPPGPGSPNGFARRPPPGETGRWQLFAPAGVAAPEDLRAADDDWPFLYLRRPMIPDVSLRGMALMGAAAALLLWLFRPAHGPARPLGPAARMFFLGAGFMLIETKAVVQMAQLFGSTWMVNSVVFFSVLAVALAANAVVRRLRPRRLWPWYAGVMAALALGAAVPLDLLLGLPRAAQAAGASLLVFAPVLFAGVVFTATFERSEDPAGDFGANVAGALFGGLSENASMLLGFRGLAGVAAAYYALSALAGRLR